MNRFAILSFVALIGMSMMVYGCSDKDTSAVETITAHSDTESRSGSISLRELALSDRFIDIDPAAFDTPEAVSKASEDDCRQWDAAMARMYLTCSYDSLKMIHTSVTKAEEINVSQACFTALKKVLDNQNATVKKWLDEGEMLQSIYVPDISREAVEAFLDHNL